MLPNSFPLVEAVILDFDGVVVDSETVSLSELSVALLDIGIEMDWKMLVRTFLGSNPKAIAEYMRTHSDMDVAQVFPGPWHARVMAGFQKQLPVIDGVLALLDRLDTQGIPYCVASGSSVERLAFALDKIGLADRFDGRAFSTELVEHGKPSPDIFLHAADMLSVEPKACLVIEDGISGVIGAKSAGIETIIGFVGGGHLSDTALQKEHGSALVTNGALTATDRFDLLFA